MPIFSGYFICPHCNIHGDWNILERLMKRTKIETTMKDYIDKVQQSANEFKKDWEKIIQETTSLSKLNENDRLDVFKLFEFPVSLQNIFKFN